ncbi:MAG: hypothetical protein GEV03_10610 [Streptosporangiales bacterium]|nr:hypothetical protein [Streptosporangiales bacterium]
MGWVSGPDAAKVLGITRQRLHQLRRERTDFPEPLFELGAGPVWARSAIEELAKRYERRRPRKSA